MFFQIRRSLALFCVLVCLGNAVTVFASNPASEPGTVYCPLQRRWVAPENEATPRRAPLSDVCSPAEKKLKFSAAIASAVIIKRIDFNDLFIAASGNAADAFVLLSRGHQAPAPSETAGTKAASAQPGRSTISWDIPAESFDPGIEPAIAIDQALPFGETDRQVSRFRSAKTSRGPPVK